MTADDLSVDVAWQSSVSFLARHGTVLCLTVFNPDKMDYAVCYFIIHVVSIKRILGKDYEYIIILYIPRSIYKTNF
jgi:hypothetical protein